MKKFMSKIDFLLKTESESLEMVWYLLKESNGQKEEKLWLQFFTFLSFKASYLKLSQ